MSLFRDLRNAFAFLTVFPISFSSDWDEKDAGRSAVFFPFIGGIVGGICGGAFELLKKLFPFQLSAVLTLVLWVGLTGGLHWDGFADCADGFGYAGTPERRRKIMKDSCNGTFGSLSLICGLLLKEALILSLSESYPIFLFAAVGSVSRWAILFLLRFPLANPNGMAAALRFGYRKGTAFFSLPFILIPLTLCGIRFMLFIPLALLFIFLFGKLSCRKIEGITGDVIGMSIEGCELFLLLVAELLI